MAICAAKIREGHFLFSWVNVIENHLVTEMTEWEFTIVSLEAKSWQFAAATQEVSSSLLFV